MRTSLVLYFSAFVAANGASHGALRFLRHKETAVSTAVKEPVQDLLKDLLNKPNPADQQAQLRMKELEGQKDLAVQREDYVMAAQYKKQIDVLKTLEQKKQASIAKEDYGTAALYKKAIHALKTVPQAASAEPPKPMSPSIPVAEPSIPLPIDSSWEDATAMMPLGLPSDDGLKQLDDVMAKTAAQVDQAEKDEGAGDFTTQQSNEFDLKMIYQARLKMKELEREKLMALGKGNYLAAHKANVELKALQAAQIDALKQAALERDRQAAALERQKQAASLKHQQQVAAIDAMEGKIAELTRDRQAMIDQAQAKQATLARLASEARLPIRESERDANLDAQLNGEAANFPYSKNFEAMPTGATPEWMHHYMRLGNLWESQHGGR